MCCAASQEVCTHTSGMQVPQPISGHPPEMMVVTVPGRLEGGTQHDLDTFVSGSVEQVSVQSDRTGKFLGGPVLGKGLHSGEEVCVKKDRLGVAELCWWEVGGGDKGSCSQGNILKE